MRRCSLREEIISGFERGVASDANHYPALSPPPPYRGRQLNRTKYNILNNYLGFLYLGVTIPNNLFVAFNRFLIVITLASSSL